MDSLSAKPHRATFEDILVNWDGYQLAGNSISPKGAIKGVLSCVNQVQSWDDRELSGGEWTVSNGGGVSMVMISAVVVTVVWN
nr:hypothetical protein [Tanacetum cinerariifolium]